MVNSRLQEYLTNTEGLDFRKKIIAIRHFFVELKQNNITKDDITEDHFLLLINSLIKPNTSETVRVSLTLYLSYILGDIISILNCKNVEEKSILKEELEDWAKISPKDMLDLKPEDMADRQDDKEFLRLLEKENPYEQG